MRTDGTTTLDHYLKPILEHDKLIVVVTAITTLLAVVAGFALPDRYQSTASVLLTPISGNPLTPLESDTEVDMATELLISTSKAVVARVADDLASRSIGLDADQLGDNVSAASPRESKVLDLTYRAATPELARITADSFAANYLAYREQIAAENRADAVEVLDERVSLLKQQLSQIEARLAPLEAGTETHVALSIERDSVSAELVAQQEALAALSTLSLSAGEILSPARLPLESTGPGLFTLATGGVVGGLVIGVVLAMMISAIKASKAPRNRRASDRIEHNRRQEDRFTGGGRRATDRQSESAVEKLARVTAGREEAQDDGPAEAGDEADLPPVVDDPPTDDGSTDDDADSELLEAGATDTRPEADESSDTPPITDEPTVTTPEADESSDTPPVTDEPATTPPEAETTDTANPGPPPSPPVPPPEAGTVVHNGVPPSPPSRSKPKPPAPDLPPAASLVGSTAPDGSAPASPAPATATPVDPLAAHFGENVPPPPRNKAKLARKTGVPAPPPAPVPTSDLRAEAGFERLVAELARRVAHRPLACLAVGQDHRAQSVAAGFALVDGLKGLDVDVLIVDAVLDEPVLAPVLDIPEVPGLAEVLTGQATLDSAIRRLDDFRHLHVLTTGRTTAPARAAAGTPELRHLLSEAKSRFPVTVVIGGDFTDAAALSATEEELDGLVVATSDPAGEEAEALLAGKLSRLHAPVWIRVSVAAPPSSTSAANAKTTV